MKCLLLLLLLLLKVQERPVKGYNYEFLPLIFQNLGNLERYIPLNNMFFGAFSRK